MQRFFIIRVALQTFLLYVIAVEDVAAGIIGQQGQYETMFSGLGLYKPDEDVVILNATNFKSSIYESKKGWLVEFYNSWCGFCHRYAPTWRALGQNVKAWHDIVAVAALDCANDDNNPICREYEIMHYPLLKYFHVDAKPGNLGIEVDKGIDMDTLRHNLIDQLKKEQQEGRGSTWPNIAPYRSSELNNLWRDVPERVKHAFLIFEKVHSFLGTEIILDLHKVNSLQVRSVTSDNEALSIMLKVNKFPTLVVLDRDGSQHTLIAKTPTREAFRKAIKDFMNSRGITIDIIEMTDEHPGEWMKAEVPGVVDIIKQAEEKQKHDLIKSFGDVIFQLDLETVLRYTISHEIQTVKVIKDEKMEALKTFLNVLTKYFPLRRSGVLFLDLIRDVINKKNSSTGEEFSQIVKSAEEEMSPIYSGPQEWIACKGSVETLRGYPCGLWTMFHMLSVNAAIQNKDNALYDPTEVLRAMHGYIKNFFGCADCSQHFVEMAAKNKIFEVHSTDDSILWLWKSHNEVNKRLAGDDTEDPEHKKIQYPSAEHCPLCRYNNGSWNEAEVLQYLKKKYSYSGINYYHSSENPDEDNHDESKIRKERLVSEKYVSQRRLGWDFTIFDISICVVLYVISAAILVLVCIKFAVKRTYRKKIYIHSVLGKV